MSARDHVVLVPGFAGFASLGGLAYYREVVPLLRRAAPSLCVHAFEGIPSAPVEARARELARWLSAERARGVLQRGDRLHLVAHSTGGLDVRALLAGPEALLDPALREALATVQFLSTPHRGTNLARLAARTGPAPRLLARTAFTLLTAAGPAPSVLLARALRRARRGASARDAVDALVDVLADAGSRGSSYERASARAVFYDVVRWVNELAEDSGAIADLVPPTRSGAVDLRGLAVRSIVTVAALPEGDGRSLYALLDGLLRHAPPAALGDVCALPSLHGGALRALSLGDHDGLVNSVSMVWPDPARSVVVEADHADVIGYFGGRGYDLLPAGERFGEGEFEALWSSIAGFVRAAG